LIQKNNLKLKGKNIRFEAFGRQVRGNVGLAEREKFEFGRRGRTPDAGKKGG